jgi:hypothetical protein
MVQIAVFVLSLFTQWYGPLLLILFVSLIIMMLDNLGKGIVLREIIALHSSFVCLIMPLVGYELFPETSPLAHLFLRWMPVPYEQYFGFALPAISGFVLFLCWPLRGKYTDHGASLNRVLAKAKSIAEHKATIGCTLMIVAVFAFEGYSYLPNTLQFAFLLFYFSGFAGLLYVYYAKTFRFRKWALGLFSAFIFMTTLNSGMFTIEAYMGMTLLSFFFLGRKTHLLKKLALVVVGIFILLIVQMVKPVFRKQIWLNNYQGNRAALFADLFVDKVEHFSLDSTDVFFPVYYRTNQGFNVAMVMRRFPYLHPYDGGVNLGTALASALVPRFLWPDKPEAGGKFNMEYYTGQHIVGFSTNVGPLGEAWGSFGMGGIAFMCCLGFVVRMAYRQVFVTAWKMPLILFWLAFFFYQVTYSAETDTLQIMNSLTKSALFFFLLYKIKPALMTETPKERIRNRGYSKPILPPGSLPGQLPD